MYGLALPRCRYEIVFKNAGKTAREYVHEAGDGKVRGPLAAAFNGVEVHDLSPCFYYRYRSISCFDGAVLTCFDLYIFKTTILNAKHSETSTVAFRFAYRLIAARLAPARVRQCRAAPKKRGSQSCPVKPLRKPATEEM
ncbi:hypothetical protein NX784_18355 [Massilia pinisoli]|uniref:CUB domain-containing protein n=1 Tax=Massilia pinisoli TaxID=1772194 RepID=A0ABT1ZUD6_9BURK|nr:hypothetical protein [Massilia pinisoli]MCS0583557.1 hypothetical protein [Massilia pinisoli]